jgi:transcriptional regulator with XRE-family HTH domain
MTTGTERFVLGGAIRAKRRQQELTLAEIGQRSGLSIGFLSQVERGLAVPSPAALDAIADALGVASAYFLAAPAASALVTQVKRRGFDGIEGDVRRVFLTMSFPGQELSATVAEVPPGFDGPAASHPGEEIAFVLEGAMICTVDGEALRLGTTDSVHLRSAVPHSWSNPGDAPARILWAGTDQVMPPLHEDRPMADAAVGERAQPANGCSSGDASIEDSGRAARAPRYSSANAR